MIISAPASSANLGPGFDTLSLALDLYLNIAFNEQPRGGAWEPATDRHPAIVAYIKSGGVTPLSKIWIQSHIPYARGLGFSGAARVAGAYGAFIQNGMSEIDARDHAFRIAGDLEGHDDNATASTYGGFCITASGHAMRFDCEPHLQGLKLLVFIPEVTTATKESRASLPETFSREDLVTSIGNVALLTSMLASNTFNDEVLGLVTKDVIHQPTRLKSSTVSHMAYDVLKDSGAVAQWLSGSGPSVIALVPDEKIEIVKSTFSELKFTSPFSLEEMLVSQDGVKEIKESKSSIENIKGN